MRITFEEMVIYNLDDFKEKEMSISYSLMTGNGMETFYTPNYRIKNNQIKMNYTEIIKIEKVTLDIIQYYNENNMNVLFYAESVEIVEKLGKMKPPKLV